MLKTLSPIQLLEEKTLLPYEEEPTTIMEEDIDIGAPMEEEEIEEVADQETVTLEVSKETAEELADAAAEASADVEVDVDIEEIEDVPEIVEDVPEMGAATELEVIGHTEVPKFNDPSRLDFFSDDDINDTANDDVSPIDTL